MKNTYDNYNNSTILLQKSEKKVSKIFAFKKKDCLRILYEKRVLKNESC